MFRLRPQYKIPGQVYGHLQHSGERKALIIAIQNYTIHGKLSCPHKDAKKIKRLLRFTYGYREEDIVVMLDSPESPAHLQPTYANIIRELRNLLAYQRSGDTFVFHFAGHSDQIPNYDGTERDNRDECIITIDNQLIRDNDLNKYLVQPLLPGSRLYAFLDTCHSGTLLDLPHDRCSTACRLKRNSRPFSFSLANVGTAFGAFRQLIHPPDETPDLYYGLAQALHAHPLVSGARATAKFCSGFCTRSCSPSVQPFALSLSACGDSENAWECSTGESTMTSIVVGFLESHPYPTLEEFLHEVKRQSRLSEQVRKAVGSQLNNDKYLASSTPQLSGLYPLEMKSRLQL